MPFSFASDVIFTSEQFSRMQFNEDDKSTSMTTQDKANTEFLVNAANEQVVGFISRKILLGTCTEVFDGQGSDCIMLREFPVRSLVSVKLSTNGEFTTATNLLTGAPYAVTFTEDGELLMRDGHWPRGRQLMQAVYTAGWSFADVPYDLRMAVLLQYDWLRKVKNPGVDGGGKMLGISSRSKQGESESKDGSIGVFGMPKEVTGILERYKRMEAPLSIMFARTT